MATTELVNYLLSPMAQVATIIALAEVAKKVGMPKKYIPLLDLILGIIDGIAVFGIYQQRGVVVGVMLGIFIGMSACGLFSGVKNLAERTEDNEGN